MPDEPIIEGLTIPPYQQRVYVELTDNQTKYNALSQFIESSAFKDLSFPNQKLLIQQQLVMKALTDILLARIKLFS